jgi:hypothetical protein
MSEPERPFLPMSGELGGDFMSGMADSIRERRAREVPEREEGVEETTFWGEKVPKIVLANAFSLGMLPATTEIILKVKKVSVEEVKEMLAKGFESVIGHEPTASFLTRLLGIHSFD